MRRFVRSSCLAIASLFSVCTGLAATHNVQCGGRTLHETMPVGTVASTPILVLNGGTVESATSAIWATPPTCTTTVTTSTGVGTYTITANAGTLSAALISAGDTATYTNGTMQVVSAATWQGAALTNGITYPANWTAGPSFPSLSLTSNGICNVVADGVTDNADCLEMLTRMGRDTATATITVTGGTAVTATAGSSFTGISGTVNVMVNGVPNTFIASSSTGGTLGTYVAPATGLLLELPPWTVTTSGTTMTVTNGPPLTTQTTMWVEGIPYAGSVTSSTVFTTTGTLPTYSSGMAAYNAPLASFNYGVQPQHFLLPCSATIATSRPINQPGAFYDWDGCGAQSSVIKLLPNSPLFQSGSPLLVNGIVQFWNPSSIGGNSNFQEYIHNIGIEIGDGNPLAVPITTVSNNSGSWDNVQVTCDDSACPYVVSFTRAYAGPMFWHNVAVYGGGYAFYNSQGEYSDTFEGLTTEGQTTGVFFAEYLKASARHWYSDNTVQAWYGYGSTASAVSILDSTLMNGGSGITAIQTGVNSAIYAKNVTIEGYGTSISDGYTGTAVTATGNITEHMSGTQQSLFNSSSTPTSLHLPESEIPVPSDPAVTSWVMLPATLSSWASTIAGATGTVYMPCGTYSGSGTYSITIPDTVNHIKFCGKTPTASGYTLAFTEAGTSTTPIIIDKCPYEVCTISHTGSRTMVINDSVLVSYTASAGAGTLHINDSNVGYPGGATLIFAPNQHVFARQLNLENSTNAKMSCAGCILWVNGYKTEQPTSNIDLTANAQAEFFGGFMYGNGTPSSGSVSPINLTDSSVFIASMWTKVDVVGHGWGNWVTETQLGVTNTLATGTQNASVMLPSYLSLGALDAATTINLSNTVQSSNVLRPGMVLGENGYYGPLPILKSLNYANDGYVPDPYYETAFYASTGGTQTTTKWYNSSSGSTIGTISTISRSSNVVTAVLTGSPSAASGWTIIVSGVADTSYNGYYTLTSVSGSTVTWAQTGANSSSTGGKLSTGYPANFWLGATYTAVSQNGVILGTGTITASTAQTGSGGINLTLGTALSAAGVGGSNSGISDVLIVRQRSVAVGTIKPNDGTSRAYNAGFPTTATFSTDVSSASTNQKQSVSLLTGTQASFYIDPEYTGWPPGTYTQPFNWININGSYSLTYKAKCTGSSGSVAYSFSRIGGSSFTSGTDTLPSCSSTSGAGWQTYTHTFTGAETGSQAGTLQFLLACTSAGGSCLYQDMDIIEGSTLAGNTTPFRDSVVRMLQQINPGSLRLMSPKSWPSDVSHLIGAIGARGAAGIGTADLSVNVTIGYDDFLQLCYFLNASPWITLGHYNTPADYTTVVNWLATSTWASKFAAKGIPIHVEDGNEPWNSGAGGSLTSGNGKAYGALTGPKNAAGKAAATANSLTNIKFISDGWASGSQAWGASGDWTSTMLSSAGCSSGNSYCPDYADFAEYTMNEIANDVDTFKDETAEGQNWNSVVCNPTSGSCGNSMYAANQMLTTNYGIKGAIYESGYGISGGSDIITQAKMTQITSGVGASLLSTQNAQLLARDAGFTGPRNNFAFLDQPFSTMLLGPAVSSVAASGSNAVYTFTNPNGNVPPCTSGSGGNWYVSGFSNSGNNGSLPCVSATSTTVTLTNSSAVNETHAATATYPGISQTSWTAMAYAAAGPGQLSTFQDVMRPIGVAYSVMNQAIGNKSNLMAATQTGTPTFNYPQGQYVNSYNFIYANTAVALVNAFEYSDGVGNYTLIAYNNDETNSRAISFTGVAAPTGAVTRTVYGGPLNATTDTNINSLPYNSPSAVVAVPSATTLTSPAGDVLAPASMATYTWSSSSTPTAATPTFSPAAGAYGPSQTVTISSTTSGASIYYTTNGTTPTTGSTLYTAPITVSTTETVQAIAVETGYTTSAVGAATFTINGAVPTPTFSVPAGSYGPAQSVTITDSLSGATIYYTTNGTTPTTSSTLYTGAVTISVSETLQAIAVATGYSNSAVASAAYVINGSVSTPAISPAGGSFGPAQTATITDSTSGATIYYTLDGSTPTTSSSVYSSALTVSSSETINAMAAKTAYSNSSVATAVFTINGFAATPTFSPVAGSYVGAQTVTVSDATSGATVYCTTNGTTPTTSSPVYSSPFTVSTSENIQCLAAKTGYSNSGVSGAAYTISTPVVATPTFSVAAGTYTTPQTVTLSDSTAGSTIYYSTNGTVFTAYSSPLTISAPETIYAYATLTGYTQSATTSSAYVIATDIPVITPTSGIYSTTQTVNIADATPGAVIYYTLNGTTPTTASSVYSAPLTVTTTTIVMAIAVAGSRASSAVATSGYIISTAGVLPCQVGANVTLGKQVKIQ